MRLIALLIALSLLAAVACVSPRTETRHAQPQPQAEPQPRYAETPPPPFPEWFLNLPSEPGRAFYGVGVAAFRSTAAAQLAKDAAELSARQQIAATIRSTIQGMVQRYAEQVLTAEGDVVEESLSRSVAQSVVNNVMSGVEIVRFETGPRDTTNGTYPLYALARISFDSVAENMHSEVARRVDGVRQRAQSAFDELNQMLREEQGAVETKAADSRDAAAEVRSASVKG